jgi:hypothetical protein
VANLSHLERFSGRSRIGHHDRKLGDIDGRPLKKAAGNDIIVVWADRIIPIENANLCNSL